MIIFKRCFIYYVNQDIFFLMTQKNTLKIHFIQQMNINNIFLKKNLEIL